MVESLHIPEIFRNAVYDPEFLFVYQDCILFTLLFLPHHTFLELAKTLNHLFFFDDAKHQMIENTWKSFTVNQPTVITLNFSHQLVLTISKHKMGSKYEHTQFAHYRK